MKKRNATCEVYEAVLLNSHVFWHVRPCRLASSCRRSKDSWGLHLQCQVIQDYWTDDMVWQPRKCSNS